jgi:branched-chain amino acid transport system ATP-binding protein
MMAGFRFRFSWSKHGVTVIRALMVVALMVWPLIFANKYHMRIMTTAGLYALLTIGVVIVLGQAGQLSFGHSAFYGIGAYSAGILAMKSPVPTPLCLVIGALAAGLIALIVGRPVLKLRYFYLALATIGLGQIFLTLMNVTLRKVSGGSIGLAPVPKLSLFGLRFAGAMQKYYLVWIIVLIVLFFISRALKFRMGRAFRAIATSEIASSSLGMRTANWKLVGFVTSAVVCGLAGGLFAFVAGAINPGDFTFTLAIIPIVMMLIGGGGSVWGAVVGAVLMIYVKDWLPSKVPDIGQWSGALYSGIMILLLIFLPAGIFLRPDQRARIKTFFRGEKLREPVECLAAPEEAPTAAAAGAAPQAESSKRASGKAGTGELLLEAVGVSVHFGGLKAVNEVSMKVTEGQIVALIGPNGAGKTTFFNAVSRLQKLSAGKIRFAGTDVTKRSTANTARLGMARTFQNLRIYPNMSVLENVLVGCHQHERTGLWAGGLGLPHQRREERASRERALQALATVGLEGAAALPAASLPYGSQRLVEIARALASEPRLLLLDEPAAGMNASERAHLVEQIRRIRDSGITVLLVEHDIELVMGISDYMYVLDYGRLISEGRPEVVQKDPAVIEAYLGATSAHRHDLCQTRDLSTGACPEPEDLLVVEDLATSYGAIRALHGVSFTVRRGEVVTILGANGAGKTTLLHTISGLLRSDNGTVFYKGANITRLAPEKIAARGIRQAPEGRRLFRDLSVEDNLVVGSSGRRDWRGALADDIAYVYELFPILGERRKQPAGTLSGGERQMLAIGRALVGKPDLLVLDEPSMGLAPLLVERIFEALSELNKQGLTMLMVEQSAEMALSLAHRGVVLQTGSVVVSGLADDLKKDDRVRAGYLGASRS